MPAGTTRLSLAASVHRSKGLTGVMVTVFGRMAGVARRDQVSLEIVQEFLGVEIFLSVKIKEENHVLWSSSQTQIYL